MKREVSGPVAAAALVMVLAIAGYMAWKTLIAPPDSGLAKAPPSGLNQRYEGAKKQAEEERRILLERQQRQAAVSTAGTH